MLASDRLDRAWQLAEDERVHLDLGSGVIDVDADQVASGVIVEHDAFGNLSALGTRLLR